MKKSGDAIKFYNVLQAEIQRKKIQVKEEEKRKGAEASKRR